MRRGRYYLGRVVKLGQLSQAKLVDTIRRSGVVSFRNYTWTITDVVEGSVNGHLYIFGNLSKYSQEGRVTVVDSARKSQVDALAPNLLQASSPFVYLPDYSGIAYLHVWNGIQEDVFRRRFKAIIEVTHDNFFVDCTIEPIADYRTFVSKVSKLLRLREISAKVHPPNPLFGRIWGNLNAYIRKRNVDEVNIRETKEDEGGIRSNIVALIKAILKDSSYEPREPPDIADAALLMAADGYGIGKVVGEDQDALITIRTGDNQKSFLFSKDPVADELAMKALQVFERISIERHMKHGEKE